MANRRRDILPARHHPTEAGVQDRFTDRPRCPGRQRRGLESKRTSVRLSDLQLGKEHTAPLPCGHPPPGCPVSRAFLC